MKRQYLPLFFIFLIALQWACDDTPDTPDTPSVDLTQIPYPKLSDYHFFQGNMADLNPLPQVLPYDLNTPLFSNYTDKTRFVYLPEGTTATYNDTSFIDFPIGSVIIKNFAFLNDIRNAELGKKLIETRLLIRTDTAWIPATYIWNTQQTEATFDVAGKIINASWTHYDGNTKSIFYQIPNKNDCRGCHSVDKQLVPIGIKAMHLNKNYTYSDGTMNQLDKWAAMGYLSGNPSASSAPKVPVWNDPSTGSLNDRARAYLDINCAHCHNPRGPANNSGLDLSFAQSNPTAWGVCKQPIAAGPAAGLFSFDIYPGKPDSSILIYRLNTIEPQIAMPELARSAVHEEGLQLLRDWISALEGDCE
jgi:uncharacterized repeat protein (TIGR03806 family)